MTIEQLIDDAAEIDALRDALALYAAHLNVIEGRFGGAGLLKEARETRVTLALVRSLGARLEDVEALAVVTP